MRCTKCLIPSSFPGSNFNENNECAWCQSGYPKYVPKGGLKEILEQHRNKDGLIDCLVGISGGKDSSYALMELKKNFDMRVEAFTYVHSGSTPFALENAKNLCSKFNIPHHIVSIPNDGHLKTFKEFFYAWVKSPSNVTAAMSCVACKHMYLLGIKLATKRKIPTIVWADCPLEKFPPLLAASRASNLREYERVGLINSCIRLTKEMIGSSEVSKGVFKNLSICYYGCLGSSPTSSYFKLMYPKIKHIFIYDYISWNPHLIIDTLIKNGWEKPKNLENDWHSDCIFTIIKEYMFHKMYGIGPLEAHLSNKIRHGIIKREEGLNMMMKNKLYFKNNLLPTLDIIGLGHLAPEIDLAVFDENEKCFE
jgi:hypothetical protein